MNKHGSLKFASLITFMLSIAILINGCMGGGEEPIPPSVPTGGKSTESVGPVIYKKVPNVIGMPLSAAKIKLSDTGFMPSVPGVYFGGGERYVSSQSPPAGSLVPKDVQSVVSLNLVIPKVVIVATEDDGGEGAGGGGEGGGGEGGGGEGGGGEGGETTTTTTEAPFADLYVGSIVVDPDEPDFEETAEIEVTVANRGSATSDRFELLFHDRSSSDIEDTDDADDKDYTCRWPGKENRQNRGFAPGEIKVFDCENEWAKPGTYDMIAEIIFESASDDATKDADDDDDDDTKDSDSDVLEDKNEGNDRLVQPIKIGGELDDTTTTISTSTTSTSTTTTTLVTSTTSPPPTDSTTTSTTEQVVELGVFKQIYGKFISSRLDYAAEYPLHWIKGVIDNSSKSSGEYFIDTYAGGIGNNIGVEKDPGNGTDLKSAMQSRVREITEEAGIPPLFIQSSELGEADAYTYQVPSESAEQTTLETLSVQNGSVWRITYKAEDLSYDVDQPVYERFLKSFSSK